jgi:hypothetical protein
VRRLAGLELTPAECDRLAGDLASAVRLLNERGQFPAAANLTDLHTAVVLVAVEATGRDQPTTAQPTEPGRWCLLATWAENNSRSPRTVRRWALRGWVPARQDRRRRWWVLDVGEPAGDR